MIKACRNGQTRGKHQLCLSNCMRGFGYVVKAFCGAIGTCVCQCANRLLLNLFLPLCSMSIAISSVVLPYWAWGEEDKVAVGLFKCCKFTEKDVNDCSPLSNCVPSDSKINSFSKATAGLLITYIILNGLTILLTVVSPPRQDSNQTDESPCCNGFFCGYHWLHRHHRILIRCHPIREPNQIPTPPVNSSGDDIMCCEHVLCVLFREPKIIVSGLCIWGENKDQCTS
ncbi:uncharacterized protein LOC128223312 [Mya arenaria]|uniref:uncharacterized protein LOC128223312 n=1 Tax=Mya arenaria TaxID=6604 RepID=UPI0022E207C3|nr:uncharacterized protein LOC128223312 [Mya arenaria]